MESLPPIPPSLQIFFRAFGIGYLADTAPSVLKLLVGLVTGKKGATFKKLFDTLLVGIARNRLGASAAIAFGGGHWGVNKVEPVVSRIYAASLARKRQLRAKKGANVEEEKKRQNGKVAVHARVVKILSTLVSTTISSLVAITVLQSSPLYARPRPKNSTAINYKVEESPTLDLTLFVFVRAFDTIIRGGFYVSGVTEGKRGKAAAFIAHHTDTILFQLSCFRIMWCWFFAPGLLPPSYVKWICGLARGDPALMQISRLAKSGAFTYNGVEPVGEVKNVLERLGAAMIKISPNATAPIIDGKLTCTTFHGPMNTSSCELNSIKRWGIGFVDSIKIYGPVHLIPQLLFNSKGFFSTPLASLVRVVLAASRSSAFLTTFITSLYATICLIRTRIGSRFLSPSFTDSGFAVTAGCFVCGFSVLIESKRRRREMGLYVLPRAVYTIINLIAPKSLARGATGELLTRWIERIIFALSTGIVTTATLYKRDLVSGLIRGVVSSSIGPSKNWK